MKVKSVIAGVFFSIQAGTFIGSAQALTHDAPEATAAFKQGNIAEACAVADNKYRQWQWLLWCADDFAAKGDKWSAERYFDFAHKAALDWAEYGWSFGIKKGCDRSFGIQGLQTVANHPGAGAQPYIKQLAAQNLARIQSQNPANALNGPWVWIGAGNVNMRQYGGGFDGSMTVAGGQMTIQYDRNNPLRSVAASTSGGLWWTHLAVQGYGWIQILHLDSCNPFLRQWRWDPTAKQWNGPFDFKWTRP